MAKTAAALIIGNEILTGKVAEQNVFVMAKELFALGVELRRIVVCADEVTTIVAELNELRRGHDIVITSGGVGPTHDDVTIKAVAAAFGQKVVRALPYEALARGERGGWLARQGRAGEAEPLLEAARSRLRDIGAVRWLDDLELSLVAAG